MSERAAAEGNNTSANASLIIVSPCFNESVALPAFLAQLEASVTELLAAGRTAKAHLVLIDDGSTDDTWDRIRQAMRPRAPMSVHALRLTRNFGHQAAICAGLDHAYREIGCQRDDTIVLMDSDGQHPPALLPQLLAGRAEGFHHVQMLHQNTNGGPLKRLAGALFYGSFRRLSGLDLPASASDFRAFSGLFLQQYLKFNESTRFNRGIFHWIGLRTKYISYRVSPRLGGRTSYSLSRMLLLAATGITYFSSRPLTLVIGLIAGFGFLTSFVYGIVELTRFFRGASFVPGWITIIFVVSLWGALNTVGQLLIAVYLARVFDEVKRRPIYLVGDAAQSGRPAAEAEAAVAAATTD